VNRTVALVLVAAIGLVLGLALLSAQPGFAKWIWALAILPVFATLCWEIASHLRQGNVGLDLIAALAMAGALVLGETLAGNIVALMYAGGKMLESYAHVRARREMTALLMRVPKTAVRYRNGTVEEVPLDRLAVGDRVLVQAGEAVPADGTVAEGRVLLDQSTLTGEAMPVRRIAGEDVFSGSINVEHAFDLLVTRPPAESAYAAIVRLVTAAQEAKAPMVRLADRYGIAFFVVTLLTAALAWGASGDSARALAVLVVATPCPLILAVPAAIMSGVSRSASRGVLVKGGGALETLAAVETIVIDKTGTLTEGHATLTGIETCDAFSPNDVLRAAATLELASHHVVATSLIAAAEQRGLPLGRPFDVKETAGAGIEGTVEGRRVVVGAIEFVVGRLIDPRKHRTPSVSPGKFAVSVALNGVLAGHLILADQIRSDVRAAMRRFRAAGIKRIVLASGDRDDITEAAGRALGLEEMHGSLTPQAKVDLVVRERKGARVMMVGDGVNDAPALAAADIGVALGVQGAAASSEVADAVLMVDRVDRLADAVEIAQRSRRIARQSALVGIGLSLVAMLAASLGYLPAVQGALLQEVIDVVVVLNALRALGGPNVSEASV
jgi:heavy metal translocating P-type ATPase